jgi:anthranilate synthase component 1
MADLETPVSAYLKLKGEGPSFLLESIEGGERLARYSFIGADPIALLTLRDHVAVAQSGVGTSISEYDDPLVPLQEMVAQFRTPTNHDLPLPRFCGGAVGYLSYEAVRDFEPRVPSAPGEGLGLPDGVWMLTDALLVFDHLARTIKAVAHVVLDGQTPLEESYRLAEARIDGLIERIRRPQPPMPQGTETPEIPAEERQVSNTARDRYMLMVDTAREYIKAGDIFQVVLSQRVDVATPVHPFTVYRALRTVNPSPYMFYLDFLDHQIVGASPELLVRLEGTTVANHPIAGTRPRGATEAEDQANAADLLADQKEIAEHVMLVDLGRNDIGRVSRPGTVRLPKFMEIERYSHVMHIVTNVEGEIAEGMSGLDALRACFPAGTVSGAPKIRAMEIIAELETDRRGPYAGAAGYVDFSGGMDTAIALRTMVVKDGVVSMQAGGGIVADSTPEGEYNESFHKMRGSLRAIELAEDLERSERRHGGQS